MRRYTFQIIVFWLIFALFTSSAWAGAKRRQWQSQQPIPKQPPAEATVPPPPSPPVISTPPSQVSTSTIRFDGRRRWLENNGSPFFILSVQPVAWLIEDNQQFRYAKELGANTIHVPVFWSRVETAQNQYSTKHIAYILSEAKKYNLKLILSWFGSNTVGKTNSPSNQTMVPDYVSQNPAIYSRMTGNAIDPYNVLDPSDPDTLVRESKAFEFVLTYLKQHDTENRVLMWQILNEVGVYPEQHAKLKYPQPQFVQHLIQYVRALCQIEKRVLGVPTFMNFWEHLVKPSSSFDFLNSIPELDLVGPDLYGKKGAFHIADHDFMAFRNDFVNRRIAQYNQGRNLFFIPETNTDKYYRPYLFPFYIAEQPNGLGMSIWATTWGSHSGFQPLVDPKTGQITQSGYLVKDVYDALGRVMAPLVQAQGSANIKACVKEFGGQDSIRVGQYIININAQPEGAVLAIAQPDHSLLLVARRATITVTGKTANRVQYTGVTWHSLGAVPKNQISATEMTITFQQADAVRISS